MQTLLLNSGLGKRMGKMTEDKPKCLIEIHGKTILEWQINGLLNCGVDDLVITTGPFRDQIIEEVNNKFSGISVSYVHNSKYSTTNYIYSIYLARDHIKTGTILLHGDLLFDPLLLNSIIKSKAENAVLLNSSSALPEKDFKGKVNNNLVEKISVDLFGSDCFFLLPLYKISERLWEKWFEKISLFIKKEREKSYAEEALNEVLTEEKLHPVFFDKEFCAEIDNPKDLEIAKKFFQR